MGFEVATCSADGSLRRRPAKKRTEGTETKLPGFRGRHGPLDALEQASRGIPGWPRMMGIPRNPRESRNPLLKSANDDEASAGSVVSVSRPAPGVAGARRRCGVEEPNAVLTLLQRGLDLLAHVRVVDAAVGLHL